ncbi:MAG: translocation/assembly module TamB, partial [Bacteroidetes bacterium QS_9_68_14]
ASNAEGQFSARASLAAPLLETLRASFDATAGTLAVGGARVRAPTLAAAFQDKTGDVQLAARTAGPRGKSGPGGRLKMEAGLRLRPDRNRLRVRTLRLATGDYQWQSSDPGLVDLYADAAAVRGLSLVSRSGRASRPQRMTLRGVLSAAPQDTLFANAENVRLGPLSRVLGAKRRIGGRLDAQAALTGGLDAPELTGQLDARRLSFEDDLIGRLTARSRYVSGSERVAFDAQLRPGAPLPDSSGLAPQENRLSARGTVALPGLRSEAGRAGALDLTLDVERADLFFLNYIFQSKIAEADGALSGSGRIGGSFRDPVFQADFQIANGSFRVPRFGLRYGASGPVRVDAEGIKLDGARLTGPDGGSALLNGALLFNDYEYFSFDLGATLDELRVIDIESSPVLPFFGQIAGSGRLRLTGPLSDASLTAPEGVRTTPGSELIIPIEEEDGASASESGFLIFADSTGRLPDLQEATQREGIFDDRPEGQPRFVDGLDLDLGIAAPAGSTVRLVFDPLLGDEIEAVGNGNIQVLREEGELSLFGNFDVTGGSYLFTAGEVFQRRFQIEEGTLQWDGSAANAQLDLLATYRTRASRAGLLGAGEDAPGRIPIVVRLNVGGRVQQPSVDLSLAVDRDERGFIDYSTAGLETVLNREDSNDEYATSVLLTNTFLLTTDLAARSGSSPGFSATGNRLAFNSVSQLVSSQLNRYLDAAVPNLDVNLGVQGEDPQDLDVVYGAALRLLDERLLIRGEGILEGEDEQRQAEGFQGEFVVEVRLTPRVSAEAFYRREGSLRSNRALTSTTGAGLSYQAEYATWRELWHRLFGWLGAEDPSADAPPPEDDAVAATEN